MEDLRALLSAYGTAKKDTAPHPEALIYAGVAGESPVARPITYLMPLHEAETLLLRSRGIATISRAVAPGFPDGLFLHTYDARTGVAPFPNRITIMTDSAKPEPQVVAIELQNETQNWHPLHFKDIPRDWSTCDYLNTENRGQPGLVIKTRVDDRRRNGGYIVASMAFGNPPPVPTGWVRVAYRPAETATWYVPQPLIDLILYTLSQRLGQQPSPLGAGLGK
jgi:hypothetical protein